MLKKIYFSLFVFLASPAITQAAEETKILPNCTKTGDCSLCEIILGFVNVISWGYRTAGAIALVFIVYAGLKLIISGGDSHKIEAAKKSLSAVVVGLFILIFSWFFVNLIVATLTSNQSILNAGPAVLFGKSWAKCDI